MLLCVQVCAQQRRSHSQQRRATTSVKKSNSQIIKKVRRVGEDGFIWYELQQGNLHGAADIEGKNIIPIKFMSFQRLPLFRTLMKLLEQRW